MRKTGFRRFLLEEVEHSLFLYLVSIGPPALEVKRSLHYLRFQHVDSQYCGQVLPLISSNGPRNKVSRQAEVDPPIDADVSPGGDEDD